MLKGKISEKISEQPGRLGGRVERVKMYMELSYRRSGNPKM